MTLDVIHQLRYTYDRPITLTPHTMYLYPRPLPYQRLLGYTLDIDPLPNKVVRNVDVEGNVQQLVYFGGMTDHLHITARMQLESDDFNSSILCCSLLKPSAFRLCTFPRCGVCWSRTWSATALRSRSRCGRGR